MKFDVITVDPPWPERSAPGNMLGNASSHWDTLDLDALASIEIERVMSDPCALLLWSTHRHLPMAFEMVDRWGARLPGGREFRYINRLFTWVKINRGMARWRPIKLASLMAEIGVLKFWQKLTVFGTGHYTAGNDEPCLLFMSASGRSLPIVDRSIRSLWPAPRPKGRTFSAKPDLFRDLTVQLFGRNRRYLELFATVEYTRPGVAWNNQGIMIDGRDIRDAVVGLGGL